MSEEFQIYKGTVHLKHTGTELICDVLAISEETNSILVKNPCTLQTVGVEDGKSQMALVPFLLTSKEDSIHIGLADVLFLSTCRDDVSAQHSAMFSPIIMPDKKSPLIM